MDILRAIELAKEIMGSECLDLAYAADTPNHAVNIANWLGYSEEKIAAIRAAAIVKRDKGEEFFLTVLGPLVNNLTDKLPVISGLYFKLSFENKELNPKEQKVIIDKISFFLGELSDKINISFVKANTNWTSFERW